MVYKEWNCGFISRVCKSRMKRKCCFAIVALVFALSVDRATLAQEEAMSESETMQWIQDNIDEVLQRGSFSASNGLEMPYRIYLPEKEHPDKRYPIFVYLHGRGQRGSDNAPDLYNRSPLFIGPHSIVSPNMQKEYPCIVLVPQCSNKTIKEEWAKWVGSTPETPWEGLDQVNGAYRQSAEPSDSGAAFLELLQYVMVTHNADEERVYLSGVSMGGFGTWDLSMRRPELFAAIVPMAGYSDQSKAATIAHIPCWIFHGGADKVNPTQGSRNMYRLLKDRGADARYTEYPDAGHDEAFSLAWNEEELLPWIFSQKRNIKK